MKSYAEKKSSKELIEEAEAEILQPRHAFDIVIPGEIRWRQDISKACQWLYALIRNLCRREGYCWATNEYLALEMGVKARCIQEYVRQLEEAGVIEREIINFGMKNRRRIWISKGAELKKFIITSEPAPPLRPDVHPNNVHPCAELKRDITEERKDVCNALPVGEHPDIPSKIKKVHVEGYEIEVSLQDIFKQAVLQKKNWTTQEIEEAWKILYEFNGRIREPLAYFDGTIRNLRNEKRAKYLQKQGKLCTNSDLATYTEPKESSLDEDTKEQPCLGSLLQGVKMEMHPYSIG